MEPRLVTSYEVEPARVSARGIIRENGFEAFRGRSRQLQ